MYNYPMGLLIIFIYMTALITGGIRPSILLKQKLSKTYFFLSMAFILCISVLYPLSRTLPSGSRSAQLAAFTGGLWLGFALYVFFFSVLWDCFRALAFIATLSRVKLRYFTLRSTAIILAASLFVSIGGLINNQIIHITNREVYAPDAPDLKIILLTDLHLGNLTGPGKLSRIADRVNMQNPDIILIAGDIFDNSANVPYEKEVIIQLLGSFRAAGGVYAVFGNHDAGSTQGEMRTILQEAGIQLLEDEMIKPLNGVSIIGRRDRRNPRMPLAQIADSENLDLDEDFVIVMDHQPASSSFQEVCQSGYALMVSGHTHSGQLFPGNLLTNMLYPEDWGLLEQGESTLAVTCGISVWAVPMRTSSPSEIVVLTIKGE